jgi:clorobiocin biosynthesis protein CloN7
MSLPTSHTLDVPGARLYYEVQGSGPALMLIGHPMGASGFASIAPLLAEAYTVVTYDPRGFARSTIDDPDQDAEPDLLADDVRRVLEAVGKVPAHVFGSSGGAVTGLALVARYPGHVETLIAHEPPLALLLPEAEEARAGMHEIYDTYRDSGISAAWERFSSFTGMTIPARTTTPIRSRRRPRRSRRASASSVTACCPSLFTSRTSPPYEAAPARLMVAGGTASKGEFPQRTAVALAERLGTPLIDFPGATPASSASRRNLLPSSAAPWHSSPEGTRRRASRRLHR